MRSILGSTTLLAGLVACTGDIPSDPGTDGELGDAYALGVRVRNPDGRQLYVSVHETLLEGEVGLEDGIEFDGFSRLYTHDGFVFIFDSESGQIVKYAVAADLSLEEVQRISLQNLGITRFGTSAIFLESDRAFYIDTATAQVVVWSPATMEIVESVPITVELEREGVGVASGGFPARAGDHVIMGVGWTNFDTGEGEFVNAALVLDAQTGESLSLTESERCVGSNGVTVDPEGNARVLGDNGGGLYSVFFGEGILPPPCTMTIPAGATAFDPDSYVDMAATSGSAEVNRMRGEDSGYAVLRVLADGVVPDGSSAFTWTTQRVWAHAQLELSTGQVTVDSDEAPLTAGSGFGPVPTDGGTYLFIFDAQARSELRFWEHGAPASVPGITAEGEIVFAERIR
ncbi:MAG: hypothetical protein AAF602_19225 [Myxococcota bacterium]